MFKCRQWIPQHVVLHNNRIYINIVITYLQIHKWISRETLKQLGESIILLQSWKKWTTLWQWLAKEQNFKPSMLVPLYSACYISYMMVISSSNQKLGHSSIKHEQELKKGFMCLSKNLIVRNHVLFHKMFFNINIRLHGTFIVSG